MSIRMREQWPWNKTFLRLILFVPGLLGLVAAGVFYPSAGISSFWFLSAAPAWAVFYLIFDSVGRRVEDLKDQFRRESGEMMEGLLVVGRRQSPGIIILHSSGLELIPIVGDRCTVRFDQILSVHEGRWLPGKFVWGKRAFILGTTQPRRIAFAVAESVGMRWSDRLQARR
jgi:hypothetical protein